MRNSWTSWNGPRDLVLASNRLPFLFDTNAISEIYRRRPNVDFMTWLAGIPRGDQFTSIVVVAELYAGAFGSDAPAKWLKRLEEQVLPRLTILEFDFACAKRCGQLRSTLNRLGQPIGDADSQIAATALIHNLILVTASVRHFERVAELELRAFRPKGA